MRRRSTNVSTGSQGPTGGPGPFTEEEVAQAAEGPAGDAELEEVAPAEIDQAGDEPETPFEKLVQKSRRLSPERVRTVVQSLLFVADRPLTVDQLYESTGIERERIAEA